MILYFLTCKYIMGCIDLLVNELQTFVDYMVIGWFCFSRNTCLNLLRSISNFVTENTCLLFFSSIALNKNKSYVISLFTTLSIS